LSALGPACRSVPGIALALALAAGAGCGTDAQRTAKAPEATAPPLRPATATEVLQAVRAPGARMTFVNAWATWCGPCREEFPALMALARAYRDRGLRLVLVSCDFEEQLPAARRFLGEQGVDFETLLKSGDDMEFIDTLNPRWTGALPASFVYDAQGRLMRFHEGKATYAEMEQMVLQALAAQGADPPTGE